MAIVSSREIFKKALKEHYAVGAFNVNNMEIIQAITEAAKEEKAPLILQFSAGARKYAKQVYLMHLVKAAVEDTGLDIVLHLDHGEDFEICKSCIDGGFTSVMIDASKKPFEENVRLTKQVVDYAHPKGVVVEAELGRLQGVEDNISVTEKDAILVNPDEVKEFIDKTKCDSLAIAIGTSHGAYKFKTEPKLAFDRLSQVIEKVPNFPLVLHGASSVMPEYVKKCNEHGGKLPGAKGVPEDMISKAAKMNIAKVNIDTDLRLAMTSTIREEFDKDPGNFDPRKYLGPARDAIKQVVKHKLHVLGCAGKA
ncbi:MAG: class II fructose-1,6-bisphosphate aldolase [Candidatus Omnitrophica bacterium]|nr:class II fructose-1,6-bisphosphate aldolase [Candidatus Omnitrophota bacterium]